MRDTMLPDVFDLEIEATAETVRDVERLCRGAMAAERWPRLLEPRDRDELLAYLIGETAVLAGKYRPRDAGSVAGAWMHDRLRLRARDWRESFYGRHGQHRTLGELPRLDGDDVDDGAAPGRDRVGGSGARGTAAEDPGDRGDAGSDALRGLLEGGDRAVLREIEALGLGAPPGARGGSPEPDRGASASVGPWLDCPACGWRSYLQPPNGVPGWHYEPVCSGCGGRLERGWDE